MLFRVLVTQQGSLLNILLYRKVKQHIRCQEGLLVMNGPECVNRSHREGAQFYLLCWTELCVGAVVQMFPVIVPTLQSISGPLIMTRRHIYTPLKHFTG